MNKLFRTFFIFLILLSTRGAIAQPNEIKYNKLAEPSDFSQKSHNDIEQLINLSEQTTGLAQQDTQNLDSLMARAPAAQQELIELLTHINQTSYTSAIIPATKSYARAAQKVQLKFNGDASLLTDIARASVIANDVNSLLTSYQQLRKSTDVVQLKNRFAEPKTSGYRDLNVLVKLPKSQMVVEVQFHLNDIAEIKSGPEHQVYEQIQAIELQAKTEQRALNDIEHASIAKLRQDSHKQYHKAWLYYKRQSAAPSTQAA
ncbi:GTP pyrophosphokinase [Shewanella inventionis]|uniref:GTP pyrophosphokinase n=1 Tax=Shewanella inventionis TaxID=1738770 RepID=A0ABQ1J093_9GAMM|nr:GTP pyrophosphokinase [Shewanella inventionis]MCL1157036.1 GTP pyrophosphokinase [Shewanella inventionis]GGB54748.1 GTP pyrophosphokinase [Shewanella inventionis]